MNIQSVIVEVKPISTGVNKDKQTGAVIMENGQPKTWTIFSVKFANGTKASTFNGAYVGMIGQEVSRELTERQYVDKTGIQRVGLNIVEPAGQPKAHSFAPTSLPVAKAPAPQSNAVTRAEFEAIKGRIAALESFTGCGLNIAKDERGIPAF